MSETPDSVGNCESTETGEAMGRCAECNKGGLPENQYCWQCGKVLPAKESMNDSISLAWLVLVNRGGSKKAMELALKITKSEPLISTASNEVHGHCEKTKKTAIAMASSTPKAQRSSLVTVALSGRRRRIRFIST